MESNRPVQLVSATEEDAISRNMVVLVNRYPDIPVSIVNYEQLMADSESMALSTIQGSYITRRFIYGGHEGEYQFKIVYRIIPGTSNDRRLKADELLNSVGDWLSEQRPNFGNSLRAIKIEPTTRSSLFAAYEDGTEDHQILMRLKYEVN